MQKQTLQQLMDICKTEAGQAEVKKLVHEVNRQGVTRLFIESQKAQELVSEMKKEGLLEARVDENMFSMESQDEIFTDFFTVCLRDYLGEVPNIRERMDVIIPMLKELVLYVQFPRNAHMLFLWMVENVHPIRERFYRIYLDYCAHMEMLQFGASLNAEEYPDRATVFTTKYVRVKDKISRMIDEAIPCGLNFKISCEEWIKKHPGEYLMCNTGIEIVTSQIPVDQYFDFVFKDASFTELDINDDSAKNVSCVTENFLRYGKKEDVKKAVREVFKKFILDVLLENAKEPETIAGRDISKMIFALYKDKPMLVCMKYLQAAYLVYREETEKIVKKLTQFFDANGIEYSMASRNEIDLQNKLGEYNDIISNMNNPAFRGPNIPS